MGRRRRSAGGSAGEGGGGAGGAGEIGLRTRLRIGSRLEQQNNASLKLIEPKLFHGKIT